MVAHTLTSAQRKQELEELCEFEASLNFSFSRLGQVEGKSFTVTTGQATDTRAMSWVQSV